MGAIEDALVGRDYRGAKAWGLALAVAILATQAGDINGIIDLSRNSYTGQHVRILSVALGGLLFGLGMTLAGTCSFGLIVRAGSGDLRAIVSAMVVGIFAFAFTTGALASLRMPLLDFGVLDVSGMATSGLDTIVLHFAGEPFHRAVAFGIPAVLVGVALLDHRLRKRPRLMLSSVALGLSVAAGWWTTTRAVAAFSLDRAESLSFVAPVGRILLQFMMDPFRNVGFGVSAVLGAALASGLVSAWRRELRWEAFDDALEMRRHMVGAALMGIGGVASQGCTIGQGLSAGSVLSITAPVFVIAVLAGARLGLNHLIEGSWLRRRA
jgi:uncharacterized protein